MNGSAVSEPIKEEGEKFILATDVTDRAKHIVGDASFFILRKKKVANFFLKAQK